jgi:hypothetical protein
MSSLYEDEMRVIPGQEPVTEITVHAHMIYEADLPDPLDTLVLLHLIFMVAGGESPTIAKALAALRAEGIRNSNGKGVGLVGRDAVQASFRRLTAAGFLRRVEQAHLKKGQFGTANYELYRRPSYNPDWTPSDPLRASDSPKSVQLGPRPVSPAAAATPKRISAGQTAAGVTMVGDAMSGDTGCGKPSVFPGQAVSVQTRHGAASPPHPPVVGTTPPSHLVTDPLIPVGPETEEGRMSYVPNDLILKAAIEFLLELPAPFACGLRNAKRFAPKLLEAISLLDWELGPDLAAELTSRDASGLKDPSSAIGKRIENLRHRQIVLRDSIREAISRSDMPKDDSSFKPVTAPNSVAVLLAQLRTPSI